MFVMDGLTRDILKRIAQEARVLLVEITQTKTLNAGVIQSGTRLVFPVIIKNY